MAANEITRNLFFGDRILSWCSECIVVFDNVVSLGKARIAATIACEWFLDPWGLSHKHRTELRESSVFWEFGEDIAENFRNSCLRSMCALILSEPCQQFYCTNGLDCIVNVNGNGFSEKVQHCSCSPWDSHMFFIVSSQFFHCFSVLEILPVIFLAGSHRLLSRL